MNDSCSSEKFRTIHSMETNDQAVESEEISDSFMCCVCLDLLYKPVVLSCGHISCFWCVFRSMNCVHESHCPICRNPYYHFAAVCQMLHFLLLKIYPVCYKRREEQILEEENERGLFSPQFDQSACGPHSGHECHHLTDISHSSTTKLESNSCIEACYCKNEESCASMKQMESVPMIQNRGLSSPNHVSNEKYKVMKIGGVEGKNLPQNKPNGHRKQISIADVQCAACKQLLFRPVVLNCGHVYCETCIMGKADVQCQVCESLHPRCLPKVCLEFHHFLEEQFPEDYALRRDAVHLKKVQATDESQTTFSTGASKEGFLVSSKPAEMHLPRWTDPRSNIHFSVGCDSCGMCPIIGDRYKCKDCVEKIGFDLCGDCYNTCSKLPGRFNQQHTPEHQFEFVRSQQHTPEHQFEFVRSSRIRNMRLRLVTGQLEDVSAAFVNFADFTEISENESLASTLSSDAQEDTGNSLGASFTHTESAEDQNETQSTS